MPRCPSCFTPMTRIEEQSLKFASCPNCFGTWISNTAHRTATQEASAAMSEGTSAIEETFDLLGYFLR